MIGLVLAPALPLFAIAVLVGLRRPMVLLAVYGFVLPWGSGYAVPVGLPPAFSSLSTLAGLAASAGILAHLVATRRRAPVVLPAMPVAIALLGALTFTVVWSVDRRLTIDELLAFASLVALFAVVALLRTTPGDLRLLEHAIIAGGVLIGLIAFARLFTGTLPTTGDGAPRFEMAGGGGESGDPNITAAMLLLPLVIALGRALSSRRLAPRVAYLGAAGTIAIAVVLTVSRGGILAMVLAAAFLVVMHGGGRAVITGLVVPAAIAGLVFASAPTELRDHLFAAGSSGRTGVWAIGMKACARHCLIGSGWGTFPEVHEEVLLDTPEASGTKLRFVAHNIWLQAGVEAGIAGLVLLVLLFVTTARSLWRLPPLVRGPPLAALGALAITNTFLSNMDFKYFWLVFIHASVVVLTYGPHWSSERAERPDMASMV